MGLDFADELRALGHEVRTFAYRRDNPLYKNRPTKGAYQLWIASADTVVGQVATTFVSDAKESKEVLSVDLSGEKGEKSCGQCALAWGHVAQPRRHA